MKCKCGSKKFILVEYYGMHPDHYDGWSEQKCEKCGTRYGRWSKRELKGDDWEMYKGGK